MSSNAGPIRILVIDDDPDLRLIVEGTLKGHFEVVSVASGVQALEQIDRIEPDFIIMDFMMPVLTGVDTLRAIKKDARFADVPVIFVTARNDNQAVREAMRAGADFYVHKPFQPRELLGTVRQIISNRNVEARPKRFSLDELIQVSPQESFTQLKPEDGEKLNAGAAESVGQGAAIGRSHTPLGSTRRVRVMIVDDDADVVNYVKSILRESYEVIGVTNAELAPEKIIAYQPDILLLDIMMPRLNGFHLSHLIRINKRLRGSKIIFVSSRSDQEAIAKAFALGASDYLEKPFTPEQLRRRLMAVVQQPDFVSPRKRLRYMEILRREGEL